MSLYGHSSFWLDRDRLDTNDLVSLNSYKRSISNFVNIVTGRTDIDVVFSTGNDSYTDGKKVVISSDMNSREFDSTVGVALHEGSHILMTDFTVLKNLETLIPRRLVKEMMAKHKHQSQQEALAYVLPKVKILSNIIEDRRIDNHIYKNSPGYKGYYRAMYDKYFNAPIIDKALDAGLKTKEEWEDYLFHITNFVNPNRQLDALNALQEIYDMIDLKNIERIKSTSMGMDLSIDIFEIIEEAVHPTKEQDKKDQKQQQQQGQGQGNGQGGSGQGQGQGGGTGKVDPNNHDLPKGEPKKERQPTKKEEKELEKAMQKQNDFMDGKIDKKSISQDQKNQLEALDQSGASYENVAQSYGNTSPSGRGNGGGRYNPNEKGHIPRGTKVLVFRGLSKKLIDANVCDMIGKYESYEGAIKKGITLGKQLGRKLKIRQEERNTVYSRLNKGKIDGRLVAELGFGNEQVFFNKETSRFNPALVHISIDASGSMSGNRFEKAQIASVAIAQACSMIENLDCVISYRSGGRGVPHMLIAYDSRKDKIQKIRQLFKYIGTGGSTPEGLCFEAVMKEIKGSCGKGTDTYFINMSDGEPGYSNGDIRYSGTDALNHTKRQIKDMKMEGIQVMSYFIGSDYSMSNFRHMYGKDAEKIDVASVPQIARTMNKLFLKKNK